MLNIIELLDIPNTERNVPSQILNIYMYTHPKIYRLKKFEKRRKKFRTETAPRTEIKGHVSGIQIHGGVYNMVVSSNVRFIRDAHARTPNSALIVNTWKV